MFVVVTGAAAAAIVAVVVGDGDMLELLLLPLFPLLLSVVAPFIISSNIIIVPNANR